MALVCCAVGGVGVIGMPWPAGSCRAHATVHVLNESVRWVWQWTCCVLMVVGKLCLALVALLPYWLHVAATWRYVVWFEFMLRLAGQCMVVV